MLARLPFGAMPRFLPMARAGSLAVRHGVHMSRAADREPGTGLRLIALALLLHPVMLAALLLAGVDVCELRNIAILPLSMLGMTLSRSV